MKKRILACLLSLCLLVGMLPATALAAGDEVEDSPVETGETEIASGSCGASATWKVVRDSDGNVSFIVSGTGAMEDYAKASATDWYGQYIKTSKTEQQVSAIVVGEGITHIGNYAFIFGGEYDEDQCAVTSITLPSTLKSIGTSGIAGFGELEDITLPDGLETIGEGVFANCAFTSVKIGKNVTEIGESAFRNCQNLTEIEVDSQNLSYMAQDGVLFNKAQDTLLLYPAGKTDSSYTIPDSVYTIGKQAFSGSQLSDVKLGQNVNVIGDSAFSNCLSLENLKVADGNSNYASEEGVLFDAKKETIIFYPTSKTDSAYEVPETVTKIGASAFANNENLTSVTLPDVLTVIGSSAFSACTRLTSVALPEELVTIESSAFSNCSSLKNITIPGNVTTVGPWAFNELAEGSVVFGANESVIDLVLDSSHERYTKKKTALAVLDGGSVSQETSASELVNCTPAKSGYLFSGWYTDADHTEKATSTAVGNTYYAAWTTVRLKESSINAAVNAEIPLETEREKDAVGDLSWTSSDDSVATVENGVVKTLKAGTVTITVTDGESSDSCTIIVRDPGVAIDEETLELSIGEGGQNKATLTVVLTEVEGPASWSSDNTSVATVDSGVVTAVAVGQTTITATVGEYTDTCTIIVVDSGSCGTNATWKYDPTTQTLTISGSGSITSFKNPDSYDEGLSPWYNKYHEEIENIVVGSGITAVGANFARYCTALTSVTIPDTVTSLGNYAFYGCSELTSIELPESIKTLNQDCFKGTGLTSLVVPASVTSIPNRMCDECGSLGTVYLQGSCESIGTKAFNNLRQDSVIYVVDASTANNLSGKYASDKTAIVVLKGGTVDTSKTGFDAVTRQGYQAAEWYEDADLKQKTSDSEPKAGKTYYADWTACEHSFTNYVSNDDATCSANGTETAECDKGCGATDTREIPDSKLAHTWDNGTVTQAATCTEAGTLTFTCTVCSETKTEAIPAKGHTFGEWETVTSSSCTDQGSERRVCSVCGYTETKDVDAAGHEWEDDFTIDKAVTCTEDGSKSIHCKNCDAVKDSTVIPATGHSWDEGVVTKEPTYSETGVRTYTCENCGETRTEEIAKLTRPSSGGSSSTPTYAVSTDSAKNGSVTVSPKNASKGTTVTITVKPDAGYELDDLTVTDKNGDTVKLTKKSDTKYTFTMPASKVEIEAAFVQVEEEVKNTFTDVPGSYWAGDAIAWASENGYMNGNTAVTFNPEGNVSRQQLWMILARLSGYSPATMAEAKSWAVDNGISDGTIPGGAVTRQQLVTILYRYAARMGYKVSGSADLTQFPDHGSVASYAEDAMSWSVANSIVGGTTQGTLNPSGTATRAQFAVILFRFYENIVK